MNQYSRSYGAAQVRSAESVASYLRRVYLLFTGGVFFAIAGALAALYLGEPAVIRAGRGVTLEVPPLVAFGMQHWLMMIVIYLGAFFAASALRWRPGINVAALFGYTTITGVFLAPTLFFAQLMASQGATLDASPVRDAFLLTGLAFTGLSGYVLVTRKNFSFMGAALNMGLWVIIGASFLGIFLHSAVFHLAIASVGVLLFSGYILYDTSRLLHDRSQNDAVGAALGLFLNVVNLFLFLLRILSSSRER
ncbi:Bax inhibitor-1/YccA family protein [Pendulispora brunnea]|uniref:Bax inhibitor-1/YccA family protein n=1 Tax=Pendulispora brunnea TaxID=2905690 RepID=A0ABZ2K933_9BACT